jgi:hypothetical protein
MLQDLLLFRNRYYNFVLQCDPQQDSLIFHTALSSLLLGQRMTRSYYLMQLVNSRLMKYKL